MHTRSRLCSYTHIYVTGLLYGEDSRLEELIDRFNLIIFVFNKIIERSSNSTNGFTEYPVF